jgi:hypothetical protein
MEKYNKKYLPLWTKILIYLSPILGFLLFLILIKLFPVGLEFEKVFMIGFSITIFAYALLFLGRFLLLPLLCKPTLKGQSVKEDY